MAYPSRQRRLPLSKSEEFPDVALARQTGSAVPEAEAVPKHVSAVPVLSVVAKRQVQRFVPNASFVLFALDLVCLTLAQSLVLERIHARLDIYADFQVGLIVLISVLTNMAFLYACGCYRRDTLVRFSSAIPPLVVALGFCAPILLLVMHFPLAELYPKELVFRSISRCATVALLGTGISLGAGMFSRILFFAMVRRHWFRRRVLVVGTGARARYLYDLLNNETHYRLANLLFVSESVLGAANGTPEVPSAAVVQTDGKSVDEFASDLRVDEVVVAIDEKRGILLDRLLTCKTSGIPISEFNAFVERETGRVDLRWLDLSWMIYSHGFEMRLGDVLLKRLTDMVVSALMLLATLPVLAVAAIAIATDGPGPIFYRQTRVTQGGRTFLLYKLRTMRVDAERHGAQWAAENDPRITRVGAFLRRYRIDEVPQLINVLRGDMSLVGPRPERPVFVRELAETIQMYHLRHSVKAGLTGWAQVNYPYGASVEDARRKLEYDLYYMKNYSLLRDIAIMLQTFRILVWPQGVR